VRRLIIGCGNAERGDDSAGLLAVRRLRELGIEAREHSGEALALIEAWSGAERVILIDAVMTGAAPGAVSEWDAATAPVVRDVFRTSSHSFGIAEAVELARALGRLPRSMTIYGIEARSFGAGASASAEVARAAVALADRIAEEIAKCTNRD
jgi:hydrogenase maturation protease